MGLFGTDPQITHLKGMLNAMHDRVYGLKAREEKRDELVQELRARVKSLEQRLSDHTRLDNHIEQKKLVAEHHKVKSGDGQSYCIQCGERWPCIVAARGTT